MNLLELNEEQYEIYDNFPYIIQQFDEKYRDDWIEYQNVLYALHCIDEKESQTMFSSIFKTLGIYNNSVKIYNKVNSEYMDEELKNMLSEYETIYKSKYREDLINWKQWVYNNFYVKKKIECEDSESFLQDRIKDVEDKKEQTKRIIKKQEDLMKTVEFKTKNVYENNYNTFQKPRNIVNIRNLEKDISNLSVNELSKRSEKRKKELDEINKKISKTENKLVNLGWE